MARTRLFDRLSTGRRRRLTLVACPAGFGKSTLLAAWSASEAAHRPVAWVTLDEGDDDAVVLWAHVLEALGRACPGLGHDALQAALATAPLLPVVLPRLVNGLVEQGEIVLVLDDFHRLSSPAARESVAWFVGHLPAGVQLVAATRVDPALPLERLRARGELVELRGDDLRFSGDEAAEFLNGRLELGLERADVEALVARTEGWPAGIYLAALTLAGRPDKAALVRAFDGTSAHVVDYLASEVLATFGPEDRRFMLRTSVLERLCAALCDAVLGHDGSAATLDRLARTNLFLLPLDDHRRWFRFHHLFARILRTELERREPALVAELHHRAAAWHRASGTTEEAVHHALCAGAYDEAGALIAETWVHYANAGRTASVHEWLQRVPDAWLERDARLLVVSAWVAALRGREAAMRRAVARVEALGGLADGPLPDGFGSLEASLALLQATFAWGDVGAILRHGRRWTELEEDPGSPWRAVLTWALGWGLYCAGDLDAAERWLLETEACGPPADQWIVSVAALADRSMIAGRRGDLGVQRVLADRALALAGERGLLDGREVGEVHTAHGLALLAEGRAAEAVAPLERGVFSRRLWAQQLDLADGLIALGRGVAAAGDAGRAGELFEEAGTVLAACPDPGVLPARLGAARTEARLAPPGGDALSGREREILRLLSGPLSEREIGRELFLSFNTVHSHVKAVYRKLGVSSRSEAVARARDDRLF